MSPGHLSDKLSGPHGAGVGKKLYIYDLLLRVSCLFLSACRHTVVGSWQIIVNFDSTKGCENPVFRCGRAGVGAGYFLRDFAERLHERDAFSIDFAVFSVFAED